MYFLTKYGRVGIKSCRDYLLSLFNAKKYLTSGGTNDSDNPKYYAVIFGSSNRPGSAYAHYLARKGFNLILIERDVKALKEIEISLAK